MPLALRPFDSPNSMVSRWGSQVLADGLRRGCDARAATAAFAPESGVTSSARLAGFAVWESGGTSLAGFAGTKRPRGSRNATAASFKYAAFLREKDNKTQEALGAIRDYRRAQWQKKVADSMEQFEVAGISQTHDEMVRKIEEQTAVNEARMDMALGNVDQQGLKIEEEAE